MLESPWSAVGNPTSALGPSAALELRPRPSGLALIGIHHLLHLTRRGSYNYCLQRVKKANYMQTVGRCQLKNAYAAA